MTSEHVIVWDLETVPDIAGYAAANGLTGKSDEEIREALGNKFQKHTYATVIRYDEGCEILELCTGSISSFQIVRKLMSGDCNQLMSKACALPRAVAPRALVR